MSSTAKERLRAFLDEGLPADAMIEITRIGQLPNGNEVLAAVETEFEMAKERFLGDYLSSRQRVLEIMASTTSEIDYAAAALLLRSCQDYQTLMSCMGAPNNVDQSSFYKGTEGFIQGLLMGIVVQNVPPRKGAFSIKGTPLDILLHSSWAQYARSPEANTVKRIDPCRHVNLGSRAWAVAYDPETESVVCTLPDENRVVRVSIGSDEVTHSLDSPTDGIRGVWIWPEERRGYFVSEFGNCLYRFNLDTFAIEATIPGCSFRPERLYCGPDNDLLVTGNLGVIKIFGTFSHHLKIMAQASHEGKVMTGRSISVIDLKTDTVTATLPAGNRPTAVAISGKYIAAGNFEDNSVTVYARSDLDTPHTISLSPVKDIQLKATLPDPFTQSHIPLNGLSHPRLVEGIAILDRRSWILVSGYDGCFLSVIDLNTHTVIDVILTQNRPFDVVVDDDEKFAYVSCYDADQVSVIDLDQREEVLRLKVGGSPQDLVLADNKLLVPDELGFSVVDIPTLDL